MLERATRATEAGPAPTWEAVSGQPSHGRRCAARLTDGAAVGWWGAASWCSLGRLGARRPAHSPYQM